MEGPNILYIHSHDTGRYVQPYGYAIPTPNLQRLAEQGVLFRKAFCCSPMCSPSRASLLTGQCPHSNGMVGLAHRGFSLNDYSRHILHTLRKANYSSTLVGVQHIASEPATIGYDHVLPTVDDKVENVAPAAVEFLNKGPSGPFFLSVGFIETHRKFHSAEPADDARYCAPPAPLPDTPETRLDMADFKASARVYDKGVGQVLAALEAKGLTEKTLVICTTDHGLAFPSMKTHLTDHGIGVKLIMRGPGGFSGGKVCEAMISHIDIFPTLCELLSLDPPDWLEGRSFMSIIRGEVEEVNDAVFAEATYHAALEPQRAVRTRRWKYIRRFLERRTPIMANCDNGYSKDLLVDNGLRDRTIAQEQLYDLIFDPNEMANLCDDPSAAGTLQEMRNLLEQWMRRTNDFLLGDEIPRPDGALVSEQDDLSPEDVRLRQCQPPLIG